MRPLLLKSRFNSSLFKNITWQKSLILFMLPICAVLISFIFKLTFFTSIFLFLGLPALYISWLSPKYILKSAIFSLIASVPLMIILEYIGGYSAAWAFPPSVFNFYILGRVSIEVLLWAFLNIYAAVIFYEVLFDNHKRVNIWNKKMWTLVRYLAVWTVIFVIVLIFSSKPISIPYFYLIFGLVLFIFPILMTWLRYPKNLPKIFVCLMYFSYLSFVYEITALVNGWWYFPGKQFVGFISLGTISFPLEELVFWIFLFAPAVISAFEYLDDDCR